MAKMAETNQGLQALKADIRGKCPKRLYFFYGEETFLLHYYLGQLKKLLIDEVTEAFNLHELKAQNFDMQDFADSVENLPVMAESTLVWVDDVDIFKLPEAERNKLTEVLSDIPDYCTVVFTYVVTPWKPDKRLKKLWDAVSKNGTVVEFPKQSQRDLIAWITRHFAAQKKRISVDLCSYLIDITGGTMTALGGEISKICSYSGSEEIKKSDIDAVTEPVLDAVVFQMTDFMGQGNYGAALEKLRQLFKMQQEPIALLGAVGGHFRRLSTARMLSDRGRGTAELMRLCGLGDYAARKTMSAARKFSVGFYQKAAELVLETDYQMKTSFDEQERLLELLLLRLAQEARRG